MLKIYNLKDMPKHIEEVAMLTQREWGLKDLSKKEFELKVKNKITKIKSNFNKNNYCKLILLDDDILVGFISIFPTDGEERADLSPWYATMFVKEEYRGNGYSKILNNAILLEAKKRKLDKLEAEKEKIEQELKKNVPSQAELNSLQEKREKLETEKNNLGLFKSKEKKMVLEQINDIENKIDNISKKVAKEQAELKKQIEPDLFKIEDKIKQLNKEIEECQKIIDSKEKELI